MSAALARVRGTVPGLAAAMIVATAATFLSEHYGAPVMLYALLLGMTLNFLAETERASPGVEFASKTLLRLGVALLGLRIGWEQVTALGWGPLAMIVVLVVATIAASVVAARAMGFDPLFGFLSGGATAICGASAALALSAALPAHDRKEQATLFTVIGVSALSTVAMVAYPIVAAAFGLDDRAAGIFIGATIHDVAQVVGAGYAMSPETGDVATLVKLLRVAMLLPVIVIAGQITRRRAPSGGVRPPLLPWFVAAFVALMVVNSVVALPTLLTDGANLFSRACLVTAIAAIGIRTRLGEIASVGWKPVLLMVAETALLAALALAALQGGLM